jgi:hypothetical protein
MVKVHIKSRRHYDDRSLAAAWNKASRRHSISHAIFSFSIWLWKTIIVLACLGLVTGGLWIIKAVIVAAIG